MLERRVVYTHCPRRHTNPAVERDHRGSGTNIFGVGLILKVEFVGVRLLNDMRNQFPLKFVEGCWSAGQLKIG